jgi:16S rRNA processing protein RimM
MRARDRLILLGAFGAPQGMRGLTRVKSLTRDPKAIRGYGPLTDRKRARVFVFDSLRLLRDNMLVARVAGVTTREAAAALTGVEIFACRDQLPTPSEDEFYYDDLVGLDAFDAAGRRLGTVASVSNYGAGDILEIAPECGGETLLLPFTKGVAPTIDFDAGRIVIEPPHEVQTEAKARLAKKWEPLFCEKAREIKRK